MTFDELLQLRHFDPPGAERQAVTGYGALCGLDAVDVAPGVRVYLRGNEVALVYAGAEALPAGLDHEALRQLAGGEGDWLRSRQGKTAAMHVVAEAGMAWSEDHGEVGFLELFPPTSPSGYRDTIYREPPAFIQ